MSFTYDPYPLFTHNTTNSSFDESFDLICEIRTEFDDKTDFAGTFSVYLRFIPPTGIPLTYVAGKSGNFVLNFDA